MKWITVATSFLLFSHNVSNLTKTNPVSFNALPNGKILDWSKSEAFADNEINVTQKWKFELEWVENIVGKAKNAGYQHFLIFPQCFQNLCSSGSLKFGLYGKELNHV